MRENAKTPERHAQRMAAKQKIMNERIARADKEQGILLVLTGPGKGKSSSGFGMLARALGHGMKVGVVQFIKGAFSTGEEAFFRNLPNVDYHVMGEGYTWDTQDRSGDIAAAERTWEQAANMLANPQLDLVILDELTYMLAFKYLSEDTVLKAIGARPEHQSVVVTGRGGGSALRSVMDTVSEIKDVEHAYRAGIQARKGVDY